MKYLNRLFLITLIVISAGGAAVAGTLKVLGEIVLPAGEAHQMAVVP